MFAKSNTLALVALGVLTVVAHVARADFDFTPRIENNKIVTGGHDDEQGVDTLYLPTGIYAFGETPGDPYNIGDPGFNTAGASAFKPGSSLRLAGLPVAGNSLSYWNGTGSPSFSAAPTGTSLEIALSPTRYAIFTATSITQTTPTILIDAFAANGALHRHVTSSIFLNNDQVEDSVPTGVYLVAIQLSNPDGNSVAPSDPVFIAYTVGVDDATGDAAVTYINNAFASVPEPGPASLALLATPTLLLRRRR